MKTETELSNQAKELLRVAEQTTTSVIIKLLLLSFTNEKMMLLVLLRHVDGLHDKIERKQQIEIHNETVLDRYVCIVNFYTN